MRVGRITPIKFVPYRDVKMILRYFSLKGVVKASSNEKNLSDVNTLQPFDSDNLKQKAFTQKSINNMVLDSVEEKGLKNLERQGGFLSEKSKINLIKQMNKARLGSRINSLENLIKTTENASILGSKDMSSQNIDFSKNRDLVDSEYNKIDSSKNFQKEEKFLTTVGESVDDKKVAKSLIDEYAESLKKIEDRKSDEREQLNDQEDKFESGREN